MNDNEVFMHVDEFGDLYLYDVLLSYIYPRVFVCEDYYNCLLLFYEISSEQNVDTWIVTKLNRKEYYSLVDGKVAIQKAFHPQKGKYSLFLLTKKYGLEKDEISLSYNIGGCLKKLPKELVYSEKKTINNDVLRTLEVARETNATTFDIKLFSGTDRHFVPQNIMAELCASMTSLTNSVFGKKRDNALRVATAPGSCIVRFSFPDQINLFNELDADDELHVINNVLSSESISDGLNCVSNKPKFLRSYSKIMDAIRKTHSDVLFSTASPNSTEVQIIEMTSFEVTRRFNEVKNINKIDSDFKKFNGKLIAFDIITKRFKIQLDDGSVKIGSVSNDVINKGPYELPKCYSATIRIDKYISKDNISEKCCLIDLTVSN